MSVSTIINPSLPQCCRRPAFDLLARQADAINSPDSLLTGAVAISLHHMTDIEPGSVESAVQRYADDIRGRVRGSQPQALLAHLHDVLFDEEGFEGNADDYYNPSNSYLPAVLQNKRGLPITLCLLYKGVADRVA